MTQKPAAVALAVGLLAVPLVPMLLESVVPERAWDSAGPAGDDIEVVTADGVGVTVTAPDGWEAQDNGDSAVLRGDGAVVLVQVYDLAGRDTGAVTERLMRANRVQGISSALDGGQIVSGGGDLRGSTCVVVTTDLTGTCAYVADEDVVVSVIALSDGDHDAPALADIVDTLTRTGSETPR